jgi:hypothetical protein
MRVGETETAWRSSGGSNAAEKANGALEGPILDPALGGKTEGVAPEG